MNNKALPALILISLMLTLTLASIQPVVASTNSTEDWPMFHHDLAHTGYTNATGPTKPVELWSYVEGHYVGGFFGFESSPAVVNGVVYIGSNWDGNIYAFNAFTGTKIWNYTTTGPVFSSPAISENTLFIMDVNGYVYALNASTGAKIWTYKANNEATPQNGGSGSSPAVVNGVVYIGSGQDGNVYALNATTGSKIWNYTTDGSVFSSPAVVNGVVYVGSYYGINSMALPGVYALNATDGALLWTYQTVVSVVSSPTVVNGVLYVGDYFGFFYALNASSGALVWKFYASNGKIFCSPAVANGVVYVGTDFGHFYALNATSGSEIWDFSGHITVTSPAVSNGVVYVSDANQGPSRVYALNASSGGELWNFTCQNAIYSSPVPAYGNLYFASDDGHFYAVGQTSSIQPSPAVPEFPSWAVLPLLIIAVLIAGVYLRRKLKTR